LPFSVLKLTLVFSPRALFCFINSSYTFWWDVSKDWDLTLLSKDRNNPEYPYGLRQHRAFYSDLLYYTAIAIDFILRFTWVTRLSTGLDKINNFEGGIFLLMFLEVARRWMWIFFRVETEWGESESPCLDLQIHYLSNQNSTDEPSILVRTNLGPAPDDILLGEYNGKIDDD